MIEKNSEELKRESTLDLEENWEEPKNEIVPGFAKSVHEKAIELKDFFKNRKNEEETKIMVVATNVSPDQARKLFLQDGTEEANLIRSHRVFYDVAAKELKFHQLPSLTHESITGWTNDCFAEGYGLRFFRNNFRKSATTTFGLGDGGSKQADYSHLPTGSGQNPGWMRNGNKRGPSLVVEIAREQGWRQAHAEIQRWFAPLIVGGVATPSDVNVALMFYISARDAVGNWFGIVALYDRTSARFPNADQLVSFGTRLVPVDPVHPLNSNTDVEGNMQAILGIPVAGNLAVCNGANQRMLTINSPSIWHPGNVPVGYPNAIQLDLYSLQLMIEEVRE